MPEVAVQPVQRFQAGTQSFDWFMLPFDKRGLCTGPRTRDHLVETAGGGTVTDVFLFSHGWNNDWNVATRRYRDFITGYLGQRQEHGIPLGREMRPLLVGVFWPSTALVFGDEAGIRIASGTAAEESRARDAAERSLEVEALVGELAGEVAGGDLDLFYDLVDRAELSHDEATELERILAPILRRDDDDEHRGDAADPVSNVDLWRRLPALSPRAPGGQAAEEDPHAIAARLLDFGRAPAGDDLSGASLRDKLDPRRIIRMVTVRVMKDRAGVVGARGVGSFLVDLLGASTENRCRVHLVGHSYGAKVCLSAICYPRELPRPVDSLLLLQPAVSHRCFADDALGRGGYAEAPRRVEHPILSTFSGCDVPLSRVFKYAVRRAVDLDELRIASTGPSRYAALGGVGPHGLGERDVDLRPVVDPARHWERYDLSADAPGVIGLDATTTISGHGDISNSSTWWALDNLVAAPRTDGP